MVRATFCPSAMRCSARHSIPFGNAPVPEVTLMQQARVFFCTPESSGWNSPSRKTARAPSRRAVSRPPFMGMPPSSGIAANPARCSARKRASHSAPFGSRKATRLTERIAGKRVGKRAARLGQRLGGVGDILHRIDQDHLPVRPGNLLEPMGPEKSLFLSDARTHACLLTGEWVGSQADSRTCTRNSVVAVDLRATGSEDDLTSKGGGVSLPLPALGDRGLPNWQELRPKARSSPAGTERIECARACPSPPLPPRHSYGQS